MRRWNGWGDDAKGYQLSESAWAFLDDCLGPGKPPRDITLKGMLSRLPPALLSDRPGISTDSETRLRHNFGQSFSDWIAIRYGRVGRVVDGVAFPRSTEDVRSVLSVAQNAGAKVIPFGGGTSVVGHFSIDGSEQPVICLSLERMTALEELHEDGCLATFQAGVPGPRLEETLQARGFTLGHYPQSFELSTLGGWIATRSAGHFSLGYGRIEGLFAGGQIVTARDRWVIPVHPASAAGPDLRQLVLGSEGRLGVITNCTVKVRRLPEQQVFSGSFLPGPNAGVDCIRAISQSGVGVMMARLSLPEETRTGLALKGHSGLRAIALEGWLGLHGVHDDACLLLVGADGSPARVRTTLAETNRLVRKHGGVVIGPLAGNTWYKSRFDFPYLRNTLWERGYGIDTLETALPWGRVHEYIGAVERAIHKGFEPDSERAHVFTHLSHVYPHGTSVYTTYIFRLSDDPDANLARWQRTKAAASEIIVAFGGTISHQHGVGHDHRPYLGSEKRPEGMALLRSVIREADPGGLFDTGNLVDTKETSS
jgi:alkyldihydroxyacetonephosphate synthase